MGYKSVVDAKRTIAYITVNGRKWPLYSYHATKKEAEDRAKTVRRVKGYARIRVIPKAAVERVNIDHARAGVKPMEYRKYGVYAPDSR